MIDEAETSKCAVENGTSNKGRQRGGPFCRATSVAVDITEPRGVHLAPAIV